MDDKERLFVVAYIDFDKDATQQIEIKITKAEDQFVAFKKVIEANEGYDLITMGDEWKKHEGLLGFVKNTLGPNFMYKIVELRTNVAVEEVENVNSHLV